MTATQDIRAGRLPAAEIEANFGDLYAPLTEGQAVNEASRCYFCWDAPCITACPTGIDIPKFIKQIGVGDLKGSANTILQANIMGGMCARVCPTESLCEGSCVRNTEEDKPVLIGMLQRHATDALFEKGIQLFSRKPATGKKIAVVGGGPAGLACAHHLAREGHDVTIFEARSKLGGLNEYGIAAYKTPDDFAQTEVEYILALGGITARCDTALGRDISLDELKAGFDAVFLSVGLAATNGLGIPGEDLAGVHDAVDYIAALRQADDKGSLPVGRRVVVIGGGSTAIDVAVQSKRLGAEEVTLVYRRGEDRMSATWKEVDLARKNGVTVRCHGIPQEIIGTDGHVSAIRFAYGAEKGGKLVTTDDSFTLAADVVFKAIGQKLVNPDGFDLAGGKLAARPDAGIFAGGDCSTGGTDLTVWAVQKGKDAAAAIHAQLSGEG